MAQCPLEVWVRPEAVVEGGVLFGRLVTPLRKIHLRKTHLRKTLMKIHLRKNLRKTMKIAMTLTTTMTLTLTMTIDAMDGVVEVVMEGRCMASVLMGLNRLVQTTRGQTSVLTAPYQPGSRLARQEEDHDVQA